MNKKFSKFTFVTVATLAATVLMNNNTVKADTVNSNNTSAKNAQESVDPATAAKVADNNFDKASSEQADALKKQADAQNAKDKADDAVNSAKENVTKAEKDHDNAVEKVNIAKNGGLDAANKDLSNKQQAEFQAKAQATDAQNKADDAKNDANTAAQTANDYKNNDLANKEMATQQAQTDYNNAVNVLNNSGLGKAEKKLTDAQNAVANAKSDVHQKTIAKTAADNAQNEASIALQNAQNAYNDAVTDKANKESDKRSKDSAYTTAKANTAKAQAKVSDAQKDVDKLDNPDSIQINEDYKDFFEQIEQEVDAAVSQAKAEGKPVGSVVDEYANLVHGHNKNDSRFDFNRIKAISAQLYQENRYQGNKLDHDVIINLDNISRDQLIKINQYALGLINGVQRQMGLQEYKLSDGAINVAQDVAAQYNQDHWSGNKNAHDEKALGNTDFGDSILHSDYNLKVGENLDSIDAGEIATTQPLAPYGGQYVTTSADQQRLNLPANQVTLYDLKGFVYNSLCVMYFNSAEWAHATNFLEIATGDPSKYLNDDYEPNFYLGVSFSRPQTSADDREYDIHFNMFDREFITPADQPNYSDGQEYTTDPAEIKQEAEYALGNAQSDLEIAQSEEDAAKKDAETAARDLTNAKETLNNASENQTTAQTNFDEAQQAATVAAQNLINAETNLNTAKAEQTAAQRLVDEYTASDAQKKQDVENKKQALKAAQSAERIAQNHYNDLVNAAKTTQARADNLAQIAATAKKNADSAAAATKKAQDKVTDLETAPEQEKNAKEALESAQSALTTAQAEQTVAQKALDNANAELRVAQKNYDNAKAAKDKADQTLAEYEAAQNSYNQFSDLLDNTQSKVEQHNHKQDVQSSVTNSSTTKKTRNAVKKYTLTIKKNKLYLNGKKVTAKQLRGLVKKHAKLTVKGVYKKHRKINTYNSKGLKHRAKLSLNKKHKVRGFKIIKGRLMVKLARNIYVRFYDLFR